MAAHTQTADLARARGALQAASASYRQALRLADRAGRLPVAALALIGLGAIAYEHDACDVVYYGETLTSAPTKVLQGEIDAGVVFRSDYQRASGAVQLAVLPLG